VNRTASDVDVDINGASVTAVSSGDTVTIIELFWRPPLPPLPWDVTVTSSAGGAELLARHFNAEEEGAKLVVYEQNVDIALGPCGEFA
jgi:hypothetical protein